MKYLPWAVAAMAMISNYFLILENYSMDQTIRQVEAGYRDMITKDFLDSMVPESDGYFRVGERLVGCALLKHKFNAVTMRWEL